MTDVDAIVVTQADRDRAAALLGGAAPDGLLEGRADSLSVVQAFATHRTQSRAALEARVMELEGELSGRDSFIVAQGLWSAFVDQLPPHDPR